MEHADAGVQRTHASATLRADGKFLYSIRVVDDRSTAHGGGVKTREQIEARWEFTAEPQVGVSVPLRLKDEAARKAG